MVHADPPRVQNYGTSFNVGLAIYSPGGETRFLLFMPLCDVSQLLEEP